MEKKRLYPLKFETNRRERNWGSSDWILWSLYGASSAVTNGFLEENELDDLIETYMGDLMGEKQFEYYKGMFPIMVSILNVEGKIPLHLHPDDKTALEREDAFGKREFWYIMEASEESKIFMGFNRDLTAQELYDRIKSGTLEEVLNVIKPHKGDCLRINPGVLHAAWGKMKIAEISEASGAMYNFYNWTGSASAPSCSASGSKTTNGATSTTSCSEPGSSEPGSETTNGTTPTTSCSASGSSEPGSDIFEAIDIVEYGKFSVEQHITRAFATGGVLAECDNYIIKKIVLNSGISIFPSLINSFIAYLCIEGRCTIRISSTSEEYSICNGELVLIPATMEEFRIEPEGEDCTLLECYMPDPPEESDSYENGNS